MSVDRLFLNYSAEKLDQLFTRIRDCVDKLSEEQIWARAAKNENAVGNLLLHLNGNVRQWLISGVGGEPDIRLRDLEFSAHGGVPKEALIERLRVTVAEARAILGEVTAARLQERVTIQKYDVTVLQAIYHVVEHFSQHVGQIIFATKMLTGEDLQFYKHLKSAVHAEKTP